jgi:hypothetical protein
VLRDGGNIAADECGEFSYGTFTAIQPIDDDKSGLVCECLQHPRLLFEKAPILHGTSILLFGQAGKQSWTQFSQYSLFALLVHQHIEQIADEDNPLAFVCTDDGIEFCIIFCLLFRGCSAGVSVLFDHLPISAEHMGRACRV